MSNYYNSLHPGNFSLGDLAENNEMAESDYLLEIEMMEAVAEIGHGPAYIAHVASPQNETLPFPNGNIYLYVMTRAPGQDLEEIYEDLKDEQLESIRMQLVHILEYVFVALSIRGDHDL